MMFAYYSPMGGGASIDVTNEAVRKHLLRLQESAPSPAQPEKPGERYCKLCEPRHRVYMHFMQAKGGWRVSFMEQDLKTSLPRRFTFQDEVKILDLGMVERSSISPDARRSTRASRWGEVLSGLS